MRILTILLLISNPLLAQLALVDKSDFDRLVIVDEYNNNFNVIYGRVYKLNLKDSLPSLILTQEYKSPDSLNRIYQGRISNWDEIENRTPDQFIKYIQPELLDRLIEVINNPQDLGKLLDHYGIDSIWHETNKERLSKNWIDKNEDFDNIEKEYASYVLSDYKEFKQMVYHHVLQRNSSGYSNVVVAFENKLDTLIISSKGQESFFLPWETDSTYRNFDPQLPSLISQFLPDDIIINKNTLNPSLSEFEQRVLDELTFKVSFFDRKKFKKYLKENAY